MKGRLGTASYFCIRQKGDGDEGLIVSERLTEISEEEDVLISPFEAEEYWRSGNDLGVKGGNLHERAKADGSDVVNVYTNWRGTRLARKLRVEHANSHERECEPFSFQSRLLQVLLKHVVNCNPSVKSLTKCYALLKKISDEFPALPSIDSFPSKPIKDLSYSFPKNLVCSLLPLSYPTNPPLTKPSVSEMQNPRGRGQQGNEGKCLKLSEEGKSASLEGDERKCTPSDEVELTFSKVAASRVKQEYSPGLNPRGKSSFLFPKIALISRSISCLQSSGIELSNRFSILENTIDLEKPISKQRNGGGAISKLPLKCKTCQESFLSPDLYSKHLETSNCSLMQHSSRKVVYPRKCDKCLNTYKTRASFSYHKRKCNQVKLPEVNASYDIGNSSSNDSTSSSNSFTCSTCSENFSYFSLNHHKQVCTRQKQSYPRMCENCDRFFKDRKTFFNHKKSCAVNNNSIIRYCPFPECTESFTYLSNLNKHMHSKHDLDEVKEFTFDSMNSFQIWLEQEGASTFSSFRKFSGSKTEPLKSFHYYCCNFFAQSNKLEPKKTSRKNNKGTIPKDINCPVRICVCEESDKVKVTYYSVHNHRTEAENLKYMQLKQSTRNLIKTYLSFSVPIRKIQEMLRGDLGSRDKRSFFPVKEAFVSRKTIQAYSHRLDSSFFSKDDLESVISLVECMRKETYDPILIFKLQNSTTLYGPSDLDDLPTCRTSFALGFQTEYQRDMLVSNSDKVLCIDSTHKTNQHDFYLINLIVPDKYGKGCPVAHFITNYLDVNTMICLFSSLKIKIPDLNVNCIMTDDDQSTFEAFNAVFGPSIRH
ncbi:hypothetical protein AVEN_69138-1 [Araneus ventricosus]|uniref:C2H2-type domain-containing protein n=1 Tax=Araneus ventricosus TaxID=182803 RepID=A0A4Y2HTJ8_ARAVE|nr:hypothetical protein AVEN_69138-1 [Araneus ventricosus]